ncbi:hypothetical protein CYJ37_23890 [Bacillus sp. UMB0728]|nr:hypothetical protein CYJ37_23890 [Bacillus sp. UMB0728]
MYQIADIHGMTHEQVISTSKELDELINKKNLYGSKKKTI